ncbi:MAG TPA: helix-turn-helix domain-containing protein [Stellaceae bacterium]|nr:helix-turn-helix domain-containing protein [Stellaceae bacterium]
MSTRDRILDAAMEVFARFGFRRAAMDQVAREAGLTRQAVYHHFKSKEALFRATVEALHEGAFEAEVEAGRESEAAGRDLADILAAQIDARFRYIVECLKETSQADELLSERQIQTRDLNQAFIENNIGLHVETIDRVSAAQGLRLRDGMTALDLARSVHLAIRSFNDLRLDAGALDDLGRMVRLIVRGAVEPPAGRARTRAAAATRSRNGKKRGRRSPARQSRSRK